MADVSALVCQLTTLGGSLKAESDKIDKATAKKLNDAIIVLQGVARKASGETPPFITAFDDFLAEHLGKYLKLSKEIGGEVHEHSLLVQKCYILQQECLQIAANSKRPAQKNYAAFFKPLHLLVEEVTNFADSRRGSKVINQLMTVKEGIGCIGWVTVEPKPGMYLKEMYDQSLFYGNRVIKEYKGKDDKQVEWMRSFIISIMKLKEYVDNYLTTGLIWNPEGKDPVSPGGGAAPPPPSGGAPPPPPPPAVEAPAAPAGGSDGSDKATAALFAQINQGGNVTSGLKKVTPNMQTHKNPELRQGAKPFSGSGGGVKAVSAPKAPAKAVAKPPRLELINKKWDVEYQKNNRDIVIEGEMKHTVYIYKCENSTIQIKNKVNSITMDGCKKTALVFDQCLGSVDTINCQSVQLQVIGKVPIVSIDKTDGAMLYLSKESLETVIVSAKSSEMNVLIPKGDGDYTEFALPEQFKSTYNGKTFVTESSDSLG